MYRRPLIVQEGVMAMPFHRLLGRAFAINLVSIAVGLVGLVIGFNYTQKRTKEIAAITEAKNSE